VSPLEGVTRGSPPPIDATDQLNISVQHYKLLTNSYSLSNNQWAVQYLLLGL